nr:PREDICTED: CDGSH iron-sulfur domain-containing protein 1 [Apteryx mantelli mantelli]
MTKRAAATAQRRLYNAANTLTVNRVSVFTTPSAFLSPRHSDGSGLADSRSLEVRPPHRKPGRFQAPPPGSHGGTRAESVFSSFALVEWVAAVSLAAGAAAVGYLAYRKFLSKDKCCKAMVNLHIQKDNPKVVHAFDMEDLGDKAVYCRCWRSKKFPLCDGSHTKHNDETGDNVGPLIIKRKEA